MYRLMQPSDEAAVVALWQKKRGDSAEFIKTALEKFAGAENIYVAEENDEIVAAALAVPVTLKGRSGSYLYGLCGQGSLILAGLVDYLCAQQKLRGATIEYNEKGYGIYFRREDTLYFVELMADDDRSAEVLMEAAREKEVIVERAVITVGAAQNLFLGEGTRQDYGMIRFDAEPFDVEESYMRLMMES